MNSAELIEHWRFRVHRVQLAHYDAARIIERRHIWLGATAVVLTTAVGAAVFSEFSGGGDAMLRISAGAVSFMAAALTALQTFLNSAAQAEKHRTAGAKFAHLKHVVELVRAIPPSNENELRTQLLALEEDWDKARQDSPSIPTGVWARWERELTWETHKSRYPTLGVPIHE